MAQQLMEMIARMGGADGVAAMAARVGLTPDQTQAAMAALVPAVTGGMARQAQAGNASIVDQLAGMAASYTGSAAGDGAVSQGNEILGNIFGSKDVSRAVAAQAASQTGLDIGALKALLPMIATIAASALGNATGTVAAPGGAVAGQAGGLGGLIGGMLGGGGGQSGAAGALLGMLDANKDGSPFDDILGMASKFLKR
ncbi:DUF937 domain-containing protein [Polymorphobacter fuscus]|uniref:DUF937 domain-containing protein n=1 Tax=Sandarakinorhabdus fusca TaxID=1439888 RepID=A0A7C9KHD7_9SPHN|nr:DUF937 domain-containing protein [Polymorphobacter fuscus]KAB7647520.1 DUF937 domain-containing protein [Polymorphobacter fuscus]MQT16780.1 DUF937 domain-containing protein [Polymorphobacter fuscus]NJC09232.1 hypothetical protein [Polymorphobacter fuscus]